MAYPVAPTNGQIYGNKKFNLVKGVWENFFAPAIGTIYTQYPGKPTPTDIYGGTWTDISTNFAGAFFRANGGNADAFETYITISTATATVITFATTHELSIGSLLKSSIGEVRMVSVINSTTQVTVSTDFSEIPSGDMLIGQGDAIRNITGSFYNRRANGLGVSNAGALRFDGVAGGNDGATGSANSGGTVSFNASRVVPTANDNRPANFTIKIWERTN